jgi:hypothetical protein
MTDPCYSYSYIGLSNQTQLFPHYITFAANNLTPYLKHQVNIVFHIFIVNNFMKENKHWKLKEAIPSNCTI